MSVLRIYEGGNQAFEDWGGNNNFSYNQRMREDILDPDGASAQNEITSIPSPFAQIDLVKTAFVEVVKIYKKEGVDLDGETIYHKMVSDALDVGEIFFNSDKYAGKIEIVKWDKAKDLQALRKAGSEGQRLLGETLASYLKADEKRYNFDRMDAIYILREANQRSILGGTSPATLFFTNATPKDLDYVDFGTDKPFDGHYCALYKRDAEYVKYLFWLRQTCQDFVRLFPEVHAYLEATYEVIGQGTGLQRSLRDIMDGRDTPSCQPIVETFDDATNNVEVLPGLRLHRKINTDAAITKSSDFIIDSATPTAQSMKPLVLPTESGNRYAGLRYTTATFGDSLKAPYGDPASPEKRSLPGDGSPYPYLTADDFLCKSIFLADTRMQSDDYYFYPMTARSDDNVVGSYLLPLTERFFDFFTVDDLLKTKPDGEHGMLELRAYPMGSVEATLRIPIRGNGDVTCVEYKRVYRPSSNNDNGRSGEIIECRFTGFIMPLVRFGTPKDAHYNVSLLFAPEDRLEAVFYNGSERVGAELQSRFDENTRGEVSQNYLIEGQLFDRIGIQRGKTMGLIIPRFDLSPQRQGDAYSFAIDLGTTNTHVEYRIDGKPVTQSFDIPSDMEQPLREMMVIPQERNAWQELIEKDYLPGRIGTGSEYRFPMRTVLAIGENTRSGNQIRPFMESNIPFTYDKRSPLRHNKYFLNIKWGTAPEERVRLQSFIENLMLLIRNKVLMGGGNLSTTSIRWFYPVSMSDYLRGRMQQIWKEAFEKYIGADTGNITSLTESEAPLRYYSQNTPAAAEVVNIDIGGGTTDMIYADRNGRICIVTSFGFAADSLFSVPYVANPRNPMVLEYFDRIKTVIGDSGDLGMILNEKSNAVSEDIASFLFGLKDNPEISKRGLNPLEVDFNRMLSDDGDYKILFLIFYVAIIYHLGRLIKAKGLPLPRHITFTGNGSKILSILTSDPTILKSFTKLILSKVTGVTDFTLDIINEPDPKTITCKGGLAPDPQDGGEVTDENKLILVDDIAYQKGQVSFTDAGQSREKKTDEKEVGAFFDFCLEKLNEKYSFRDKFGVSTDALNIARSCQSKDVGTFIDKGLQKARDLSDGDEHLSETPFFYAIKGVMSNVANEISIWKRGGGE